MVKIVEKTLISEKAYKFQVEPWMLGKSLAHHFFEQRLVRSVPGFEADAKVVNVRNADRDVMCGHQLEGLSRKLASGLKNFGFKKNDASLLMIHNNVHFYCPVFATWFLGGHVSVGSPILSPAHLAKQLSRINIRHIFCGPSSIKTIIEGITIFNANKIEDQIKKIHVIVMDTVDSESKDWKKYKEDNSLQWNVTSMSEVIESNQPITDEECPKEFSEKENSVIFWSSGTTGDPKGIVLDYSYFLRNLVDNSLFFDWPNITGQKFLVTTNMFHGGGFCFVLVHGLRNGHTCIIFTPTSDESVLTTDELFQACHTYRPEVLMVGSHHAILLGHTQPSQKDLDLTSVKWLMPMGAPVRMGLTEELRSNFPNFDFLKILYGMTESMLISVWNYPSALGKIDIGVQLRIVDNNKSTPDQWHLLGPNQIGEIQTLTPFMMKGYLDEDLNDKFWTKDGFCRTGDLGHYDEDGILYFNGRLKDLIKYQGNHLYPKELESIIQKHPAVAEVVVFGLPHPEVQELVTALVVKKNGYPLTEKHINDCLVEAGVESFKHIRGGVKFVHQFPKNSTGKIERTRLPEFFLASQ